jgi:hypothetical protein
MGRKRDRVALPGHDIATTHLVLLFPDGSGPGSRLVTRARRPCGSHHGARGSFPTQELSLVDTLADRTRVSGPAQREPHDESRPGGHDVPAPRLRPRRRTARAAARRGDGPPGACRPDRGNRAGTGQRSLSSVPGQRGSGVSMRPARSQRAGWSRRCSALRVSSSSCVTSAEMSSACSPLCSSAVSPPPSERVRCRCTSRSSELSRWSATDTSSDSRSMGGVVCGIERDLSSGMYPEFISIC